MDHIYRGPLLFVAMLLLMVGMSSAKKSKVITVTSENWRQTLEGEWMIKFYAPWCPACKSMEADYKDFADWSDDLTIRVAEVNINDEPGLSGRFIVTALPSIYHAKDGEFRRYAANRDSNSLHKYIEERTWMATDPVSWYRHPDSIPMTLMAGLFQTSVMIKGFHETLTESYGFSATTSYIIFGLATVITGLLLGLVLVFIIDCFSPPKPKAHSESLPDVQEVKEGAISRESAEEEEDDHQSIGKESVSGSEDGRGSQGRSSESEDEPQGSQASSKSSSQTSQGWEKVQGEEEEQSLDVEREIADEKEEGQGEVRRRNVPKPEEGADEE